MNPLRLGRVAPIALLSVIALGACTSANPGWTYQPAPSPTAQPSVASAEPSGGQSAAPSGDASAQPSASDGGHDGEGEVVKISAVGIAFEQAEVNVPAGVPFRIEFANNDAGVPHNVAIRRGDANGEEVFKGEIFNGVETRTYDVPALDAGAYGFICSVHPNMVGTMTAL